MSSSIHDFYIGKNILLTGTTGFVGKVLLEKILRTLPQIERVYILIRNKKGSSVQERFKKEILGSQCFDRIKKIWGLGFDEYINTKVCAVAGDMLKHSLGLSSENEQMLIDNINVLNIIINCAASVDFNSKIHEALSINYYGTQRMLNLASKCKHIENFMHMSTAYVNSNITGFIEERLYDDDDGTLEYVEDLMGRCQNFTEKEQLQVLDKFPNTYTFTKNLAEKMLKRQRPPTLQVTIVRPTMVGASLRDPVPGWIDNIVGSSAMYFFIGIGLIKEMRGDENLIGDQIPVDFVADHCIVASAYLANKQSFQVLHQGTSSRNPVQPYFYILQTTLFSYQAQSRDAVNEYWQKNIPSQKVSKCQVTIPKSNFQYKMKDFTRSIPPRLYNATANVLGNSSMRKNAKKWIKLNEKAYMINETFGHFNSNEWIFDSNKTNALFESMSAEESQIYQLDVKVIDWRLYLPIFHYGIQKYILKENVDPPGVPQITNLFSLWDEKDSDIKWVRKHGLAFNPQSKKYQISLVMRSQRVQNALQQLLSDRMKKQQGISESSAIKQINKEAIGICDEMFSTYSFKVIRTMSYMLTKILKQIYEKVVVDENYLTALASHDYKTKGPLVFVPSHKSYLDFLISSYIFYAFQIQCPHVATTEDFLQMNIVPSILRSCGAFFMKKKSYDDNVLYKAIFVEYIQSLMMNECYLEFFVEGNRSRTGKIMTPKFGLLGIIVDTVAEKKIPDATLIPMSINYENVMEADTYPLELLGESKVRESFIRLIEAAKVMSTNQGRVYVEFGEPISIKNQLIEKTSPSFQPVDKLEDRKEFTEYLGMHLAYTLIDKLIIMPTSMVAAVILMQRKGIQEDQLVKKIEWLTSQIQQRGGKIGSINDCSAVISVRNSINHLKGSIIKTKRNIFELQVAPNLEYKNVLLLSYYRNMLSHLFYEEAIVATALNSFGHQLSFKEGITLNRLWEESEFLFTLLFREHLVRNPIKTKQQFNTLINNMVQNGTLVFIDQEKTQVKVNSEQSISFLCSLIWPLVESYWVTLIYIYSVQKNNTQLIIQKFVQNIQWFAESMYEERVMEHYESCSQETMTNAVRMYNDMQLLSIEKEYNERAQQNNEVVKVTVQEDKFVELENYIQKFMKNAFLKSIKTPFDVVKKNVIDFSIFAKL